MTTLKTSVKTLVSERRKLQPARASFKFYFMWKLRISYLQWFTDINHNSTTFRLRKRNFILIPCGCLVWVWSLMQQTISNFVNKWIESIARVVATCSAQTNVAEFARLSSNNIRFDFTLYPASIIRFIVTHLVILWEPERACEFGHADAWWGL